MSNPTTLQENFLLEGRYLIQHTLGRGGFGAVYSATDEKRGDRVVVKELLPPNALRNPDGSVEFVGIGSEAVRVLRSRFLNEARMLSRVSAKGVPVVRDAFVANGTGYVVREYLEAAIPSDEVIRANGPMSSEMAVGFFLKLVDALEACHSVGVLHCDLKPSNILVQSNGDPLLIDFGASRQWHADCTVTHSIIFTPGYAPLEQLSEKSRRGPATDIYGLCATLYCLLAGFPPTASTDRANGRPVVSIKQIRPDIDPRLERAMNSGLALGFDERPKTMADLRNIFIGDGDAIVHLTLDEFDEKAYLLKTLKFGRRECPVCSQPLENPRPLKSGNCPVCREGRIQQLKIFANRCPVCEYGSIRLLENAVPLNLCPLCNVGSLVAEKGFLRKKMNRWHCSACHGVLEQREDGLIYELGSEDSHTWDEWRARFHRTSPVAHCDECSASFDVLPDGRWHQRNPEPSPGKAQVLYPEEWWRVASGFLPGCGTHQCSACDADYFVEGEAITLLSYENDPFEFGSHYAGVLLDFERLRWLGVGKSSPKPGLVCSNCSTEFDQEGQYLRLIQTGDARLSHFLDQLQTLEDWHRIHRNIPPVHDEGAFYEAFQLAIVDSFREGLIDLDDRGTLWRGSAVRLAPKEGSGTLTLSSAEITFGGLLRKDRYAIETIHDVQADQDEVSIHLRGEEEPVVFEVEEITLTLDLRSGPQSVHLAAGDLAIRISRLMRDPVLASS